jgi:tumor protein p53-inducible protein 3
MALLGGGGNAEYAVADAGHVLPVPASLDMAAAAAVPEVWLTAFQLLHLVAGGVKPGQSVLVHAGGSGVGTAAVQLVKLAGGRSMVTAGSQQKIDTALSLGAERGVNYKTEDFAAAVAEWTGGKGVDIILDCVGGSYAMKNVTSLAVDGRWVLYGLMGGAEVDGLVVGGLLRKRGSLLATTIRSRSREYKADVIRRFRDECLAGFIGFEGEKPLLKPIVDCVMDVSEIKAAHEKMEENKNNGKIVLTF